MGAAGRAGQDPADLPQHLQPNGVAYVSYNTFPGWHARAAIREMLCYHTERFDDPSDRIREARGLLTSWFARWAVTTPASTR